MGFNTCSIVDARGRTQDIAVVHVLTMTDNTEVGGVMTLRKAQHRAGKRRTTLASGLTSLAFLLVGLVTLVIYANLPGGGTPAAREMCKYFMIAGVVGAPIAALALSRRPTAEEMRPLVRGCGCCLACGYALRGVPEQTDGCTVCPECGAAWLV